MLKSFLKCFTSTALLFFLITLLKLINAWAQLGPMKKLDYNSAQDPQKIMKLVKVTHDPKAKCLDGSYPAFYIRKGFGTGSDKFVLYLEGGGWCYWPENFQRDNSDPTYYGMNFCDFRATTKLGSTVRELSLFKLAK